MMEIFEMYVTIINLSAYFLPAAVIIIILVTIFIRQGEAQADLSKIDQWLDKQIDREVTFKI